MQLMRAANLDGYIEVANSVGLDGVRMLRQAGIALETLNDPENRVPAAAVVRLVQRSAEESGCESFGLLIAETRSFASLGPLSLLLERLPNLRAAIRTLVGYQRQLNDVISTALEESGDTSVFRLDLSPSCWSEQALDQFLGSAYRVITGAAHGRWKPDRVYTIREAPADLTVWRRMIPVPVEFGADFSGFSCSTASLLVSNPFADEAMARNARQLLRLLPVRERPELIADKVRRTISLLLPSSRATVDQVAIHLGVSSRSLQRRLDEEGLQFAELLSEVRQELAAAYLAGSERPVTSVAALLGYSSPSSFTRWFAGAFGVAPQVWRARQRDLDRTGPPPVWRR